MGPKSPIVHRNRVRWLSHEFFRDRCGNRCAAHGFVHLEAKTAIERIMLLPRDVRHRSPLDSISSR